MLAFTISPVCVCVKYFCLTLAHPNTIFSNTFLISFEKGDWESTASPVQHCKQFTKWEHIGSLFNFVIVYHSLAFCPGIRNCGTYTSELRTDVFVDVCLSRWLITCSILSEWITLTRPQFHVRNTLLFLCALWVWRSGIIFEFHFWN